MQKNKLFVKASKRNKECTQIRVHLSGSVLGTSDVLLECETSVIPASDASMHSDASLIIGIRVVRVLGKIREQYGCWEHVLTTWCHYSLGEEGEKRTKIKVHVIDIDWTYKNIYG